MMQAAVLALVQGLTEFLPISSSAHLILVPWFLDWPDQGLAFDVVVHLGTLTAVCGYFRQDILNIVSAMLQSLSRTAGANESADSAAAKLGWLIVLATIPVGLVGLLAKDWVSTAARNPALIGVTSIVFGLLLWWADRLANRERPAAVSIKDAVVIGMAQALALIPGVSRSGITMTAGMALGLTRSGAARFSFLLSIPVIALSGGMETLELIQTGTGGLALAPLLVGFTVAAASAYLCIKYLMIYLQRQTMGIFVIYRVALGVVILALVS
jgi:undecaprenyl-diphosphatase